MWHVNPLIWYCKHTHIKHNNLHIAFWGHRLVLDIDDINTLYHVTDWSLGGEPEVFIDDHS